MNLSRAALALTLAASTPLMVTAAETSAPAAPKTTAAPAAPAPAPARPEFPAFGSAAPEFKPAFVIRGPIPANFNDDAVHLVGMFSTRLASSLKSIPYLNDFHRTYASRGVRVTGVSVWEESESAVKDFVAARGDTLQFAVAFDGRDAGGTVSKHWQEGASINAVPYLFILRRGTVLWHGAPDELPHATIDAILAGTYDAAAEMARREAIEAARLKAAPVSEAIEDLLAANKADEALAKCDELEKLLPECDRILATQMRAECHFSKGDFKTGFTHTAKFVAAYPNDAQLHATVALEIVAEPRFKERDYALAKRCIDRALAITPVEPYRLLKARVLYAAGDIAGAESILTSLADPKNDAVRAHMKLIREAVAARLPWPIPPKQDCACGAH